MLPLREDLAEGQSGGGLTGPFEDASPPNGSSLHFDALPLPPGLLSEAQLSERTVGSLAEVSGGSAAQGRLCLVSTELDITALGKSENASTAVACRCSR